MADLSLQEAYANHPIISTITNKIKSLFDFQNPLDTIDIVKEYNSKQSRTFPPSTKDYITGLAKEIGEKKLEHLSDGLSIFNVIAPSQYYRATKEAQINGFNWRRFCNSVLNGNSGFVDPVTAEEHPIRTAFINAVGDVAVSSPKSVVNLAKAVVKQGVKRPPISPALAIASTNEVIPAVVPATVPLKVNAISAIPAINNGTKPYMALGKVEKNPRHREPRPGQNPNYTFASSYSYFYPIEEKEQDFIKALARLNNMDISKVDIQKLYKDPSLYSSFGRTFVDNNQITHMGMVGKSKNTFADVLYRLSRADVRPFYKHGSEQYKLFNSLGVSPLAKDSSLLDPARGVVGDVRGQLFEEGLLKTEDLGNMNFKIDPEQLPNYLSKAHGGEYARKGIDILGFDVVDGKYTWKQQANKQAIADRWSKALHYLKNGHKLLPRRNSKKMD